VNALNAHLTSGSNGHNNCYLGPCQERCFSTTDETPLPANASRGGGAEPKAVSIEDEVAELTIKTSPNPSTTFFVLQIQIADKQTPASAETDLLLLLDACEKDDHEVLNENGSYTHQDAGTVCSPSGTYSGPW